jgi:AcrR family transcriptional regulator
MTPSAMTDPVVRERILDATVTCIGRSGMAGLTLEQVATEAGVGRATVYRYFAGGRDQLISEAIAWEVAGFFTRLAEEVDDTTTFRERLERGLVFAHRSMAEHEVFQHVLATERERLLVRLAELAPLSLGVVRGYLAGYLVEEDLVDGVDVDAASWYLARMVLSFLTSPGSWDLDDPDQVAELVDTVFLAGVVAR